MSFDLQLCPGPGDCQLLTVNCACVMLVRMQLSGGWGGYWDITENTQGETWKWHSFMFKESVDASGHIINFGKVQRCAVHTFYILKQECPHFDGRELESFGLLFSIYQLLHFPVCISWSSSQYLLFTLHFAFNWSNIEMTE